MSFLYKKILRPVFFLFDPELIHDFITWVGEVLGKCSFSKFLIGKLFLYKNPILEQKLWGIKFQNPVGLGAGFDKDARAYSILGSVGFGFTEIGTVTHESYEGNPKPRLYRLPKSKGLVVNYGLKSLGAKEIIKSLQKKQKTIPQIISIGRTNSQRTADPDAGIESYYNCLKEFLDANVGDAYEINISCPNLFGGEPFNDEISLEKLLSKLYSLEIKKPVFIKMPINLPWSEFQKLVDVALKFGVQALVIGNLNKDRKDKLIKDIIPDMKGSVSGKPTQYLSNYLISKTYQNYGTRIKIIGVGGIFNAEDAYKKIKLGASMVELITGMIYEGPQLIGEINKKLTELLEKDGYKNIKEAVGTFSI